MKIACLSAAALAGLLVAGAAGAQPAQPNYALPKAYAGYDDPEAFKCETKDATHRDCAIPAMTAGRYLIVAVGAATSSAADATQSLAVVLSGEPCFVARPTSFSGTKAMRGACEVSLLTDQPMTVSAVYRVTGGAPDAKGPQLVVRRLPWNGVVEAKPVVLPPPAPSEGSAKATPKK